MKRITMTGWFVIMLSLMFSSQFIHSSEPDSRIKPKEIENHSHSLAYIQMLADVCGLEGFNNAELPTSYSNGSFVGNNGVTWTYVESRDENGDNNNSGISGNAIMLRRIADGSKITSSAVPGGISDFSVKLYKGFTGGGDRQVELFVNGVSYGLSEPFDDFGEHTFTVTGINIAGDVIIEIRNATSKQVIVDDITWTCASDGEFDCPALEANIGDACDDMNASTENDIITVDCECEGTPIVVFDCPELEANIGDACNDGDATTENDMVTEDCQCAGTPIVVVDYCVSENFDNAELPSSYSNGSFVGNDGVTWTYVASRDENGDSNNSGISGNALMLRRIADGSKITSSAVPGGISDFSVKLYKGFTGGGDRQVELFVNGVSYGLSEPFDDFDEHIFTVTGIDIAGDVLIEIRNATSKQVIVDDINWTCGPEQEFDCPELEANIGDACDDMNASTENDIITENCECAGTPIVVYDCPELEANIGDACDDGDATTENDMVTEDCQCAGTPIVVVDYCVSENFDNAELPASYSDGSFVGNDGVTWTYVQSRDENGDSNNSGISGNALMLRRISDGSKITSSVAPGGISDFSVKLYKGFTGGGDRQVELFVNGVSYGLSVPFDDFDEHIFTVTGIDIAGDVIIEIRNATSRQIIVDDISWTCGPEVACTAPELTLTAQDANGEPLDCLEVGGEYYVLVSLSGGSGNTSYNVAANDFDFVEVPAGGSTVFGPVAAGTMVNASAMGVQDQDCSANATLDSPATCAPANDNCGDAMALSCGGSMEGTTYGATYSGETDGCTSRTSGDVFYILDVVAGDEYTVTVAGNDYDAVLAIYSGACGSLTEIACADSGFSDGMPETITWTADATETLVIRTYDWSSTAGSFTITVDCTPVEDSCGEGDAFVTTWMTTSSNESITIPTFPGAAYSYTVDWGDGSTSTDVSGDATHMYDDAGTYTVSICGAFPRIYFNNNAESRMKLRTIEQWGTNMWTSMNGAFAGAGNMVSNATDMPDLSMVTDMYGMFAYARKFNGDANFGNWDVSNVTNMYGMFGGASVFNHPIGGWNVGNVTNMADMFHGATKFNQNLSAWNVGNVTTMKNMFFAVFRFNSPIGNWNVGNVTDMSSMFFHAHDFDQDLGNWNVSNVSDMRNMFKSVTLSTDNYDSLLMGWSSLVLKNNVRFHGGNSIYCAGEAARQAIIANYNWIISDGGMDCEEPGDRLDTGNAVTLINISLYPNPMRDQLNLGNPANVELESLAIYDLTGRLVRMVDLKGMTTGTVIDVSELSSATYMVIIDGKYGRKTELLIKE